MRNKKIGLLSLSFLIVASSFISAPFRHLQSSSLQAAKTLVLYDAASGNVPDASLMSFTAFPPDAASLTYGDGAAILDTSLSSAEAYAGWVSTQSTTTGFPILDPAAGFAVRFTLQVESERHSSTNRAGFSIIVLDQSTRGIELAFWEDEIWAQNDDRTGSLFTHGEGAAFDTTSLMEYQLAMAGDTYTLTANGQTLLTGPVRDYSSFTGFPDPYQTPNFLFLGDDTTSCQARVRLAFLAVTGSEPIAPAVTTSITSTPNPPVVASPTPADRDIELCPSSGMLVLAALMMAAATKKHYN